MRRVWWRLALLPILVVVQYPPSVTFSNVRTPEVVEALPLPPVSASGAWTYPALVIGVEDPPPVYKVAHRTIHPPPDGSVIGWAKSVIGVPYVSGGSSPAGFDCSGFVSWVYWQTGVSVPGTVAGIRARGTVIPASEARPGDVLYWGTHVGIYVGAGLRIDANRPGSSVQIRALYGDPVFLRM